jgi:hypothetical protein
MIRWQTQYMHYCHTKLSVSNVRNSLVILFWTAIEEDWAVVRPEDSGKKQGTFRRGSFQVEAAEAVVLER